MWRGSGGPTHIWWIIFGSVLSIRIVADPKREAWANELSKALDAPITWDERNNTWDTHRRALLSATGSHCLIVQDDAVLSEGLVESVSRAVEYSGEHPICLYSQNTKRLEQVAYLNPVSWWAVSARCME